MSPFYLDFPYILFIQNAIINALSQFRYFRGDLQVEFRMNTTPFHSGALLISWLPATNAAPSGDPYYPSGNHPTIISASTQQAATIQIPYLHPCTWLDIVPTLVDGSLRPSLARVYVHELAPLTVSSADISDTVVVQVFACFKNTRVAGYVPGQLTVQAQSLSEKTSLVSKPVGDPTKVVSADGSVTSQVRTQYGTNVLKADTSGITGGTASPEAEDKTAKHSTGSPFLDKVFLPIIASLGPIGKGLSALARAIWPGNGKLFGMFDKPTSSEAPQYVITDFCSDMAMGEGRVNSYTLSLYKNPRLGSFHDIMGGETSRANVAAVARIPMIHRIIPFTAANQLDANTQITPFFYNNPVYQPDYLMWVASAFSLWRGSIKYMIQFITTAFTTARFRIAVNYVTYTGDVTTSGDVVSRIVDVKGDTTTSFTVPYLFPTHWQWTTPLNSEFVPRLSIEVLEDIQGQSLMSDPLITAIIWRAGGEDMEFSQYSSSLMFNFVTKEAEAQTSPRECFREPFDGIVSGVTAGLERGFVSSEVVRSISDCCKRFVLGASQIPNTLPDTWAISLGDGPEFWSQIFLFWRGSRRIKSFITGNTGIYAMCPNTAHNVENPGSSSSSDGVALLNAAYYPILNSEMPWVSTLPYWWVAPSDGTVPTNSSGSQPPLDFQVVSGTYAYHYIACGEDFEFGFLKSPPQVSILSGHTKRKVIAEKKEKVLCSLSGAPVSESRSVPTTTTKQRKRPKGRIIAHCDSDDLDYELVG